MIEGDLVLRDGRIEAVGGGVPENAKVRRLDGRIVLPGFVQGHTHLGQSLFRGLAERRDLLPWLRDRVWPLEAAHDEESTYWSGVHGALDCLLGGTTTIQDMGLVRHTDALVRAIKDVGLRAIVGPCLMDAGEAVPAPLLQDPDRALADTEAFARRWAHDGEIRPAVCPRFILSCTSDSWRGAAELATRLGLPVHTHLLEHRDEEAEVRSTLGRGQMELLDEWGVLDTDLRVAHGVWFDDAHARVLRGRSLSITHCPSANLKLGSGIADIERLGRYEGIRVGIGCDGAPCNNDMDILEEIRLAALLQGVRAGPARADARGALDLATRQGARALGLLDELGSLEVGKRADLVVLDLSGLEYLAAPSVSIYDQIVYTARRACVREVYVGGVPLVMDGVPVRHDGAQVARTAREHVGLLTRRAGIDG